MDHVTRVDEFPERACGEDDKPVTKTIDSGSEGKDVHCLMSAGQKRVILKWIMNYKVSKVNRHQKKRFKDRRFEL